MTKLPSDNSQAGYGGDRLLFQVGGEPVHAVEYVRVSRIHECRESLDISLFRRGIRPGVEHALHLSDEEGRRALDWIEAHHSVIATFGFPALGKS